MKTLRNSQSGMALVLTLFFAAISITLLGTLTLSLIAQRNQIDYDVQSRDCFNGLEAAYNACKVEMELGNDGLIGLDGWTVTPGSFTLPSWDSSGVTPVHMQTVPGVEFFAIAQKWKEDGIDNNNNGLTDAADLDEQGMATIHSFARKQDTMRQTEAVVAQTDVNVWRNAIFAGGGQSGGLINGNVSIHGSVHLLGDDLPETGMAIAAIDLSGTSLIHNNYAGISPTLAAMIPALPTSTFNGESVQTLSAELRVKNGLVGMSGNSEIGELNVAGDADKETMDATYVNDGWTGTSATPTADGRGIPTNCFSDNGYDEQYDLGNMVSLPMLDDDWRSTDGAKVWNNTTNDWYTHDEYFTQVLLGSPTNPTDGIRNANMTLNVAGTNTAAVYWNATTGQYLTGTTAQAAAIPPSTDDYLIFNPATNLLRVNGQIKINGTLSFAGQGNDRTIYYTGRGAILTTGDVTVDTNMLSCNNGNTASTANSYPVNNCLGVMTRSNMYAGMSAQLQLAGAFYAQNMIKTQRQTTVLGTFVSDFFDMGTNVPEIYQVPTLATNLPFGMVGYYPILATQRVTWREIGLEWDTDETVSPSA